MNDLNDCSYHIEHQQSWNHMKNCGTTNTVLVNMQLCSRFSCNKKHFIKNSFDQEFVTSCHKSVNIFFLFWIQKERNIDSLWSESADREGTAAMLCFAPRIFEKINDTFSSHSWFLLCTDLLTISDALLSAVYQLRCILSL